MKALVFVSENCPYCRYFKKVVERLERELEIEFEVVDVDNNPEMSEKYSVMILPTLVLVNGNEVVGGFMGLADFKTAYAAICEQILAPSQAHNKD